MTETRALYRPGRIPPPVAAGKNLPRGHSADSLAAREAIGTAMTDPTFDTVVWKPMHASDEEYDQMVEERMRNMTLTERNRD